MLDRLAADRPEWVFTTGSRPRAGTGDETPPEYVDVWSALAARGLDTITIRDSPWLRHNEIRYAAADCLAGGGDPVSCGMRRSDALDPVDPQLEPASRYPNIFPIDLSDAFCDASICPVVAGNILIYHDEHHLTSSYSRSLSGGAGPAVAAVAALVVVLRVTWGDRAARLPVRYSRVARAGGARTCWALDRVGRAGGSWPGFSRSSSLGSASVPWNRRHRMGMPARRCPV